MLYKGSMHPGNKNNFKIFSANDFLAAVTSHIPKHRQKYTNYYGVYSNVYRGKPHSIDLRKVEATETQKEYRKRWTILIRKVWEVDPLKCPRCGSEMAIDEYIQEAFTYLYKKMLVAMGAWYEEPERAPPITGPPVTEPMAVELTYEPVADEWGSVSEFEGA